MLGMRHCSFFLVNKVVEREVKFELHSINWDEVPLQKANRNLGRRITMFRQEYMVFDFLIR